MAKRKGKGRRGAKKPKKPSVAKSGRATQAKEPEGAKAGKPKGSSSKISKEVKGLLKKQAKATDERERNRIGREIEKRIKKFRRKSTRESYSMQQKRVNKVMKGLTRAAGGAANLRKMQPEIGRISRALGAASSKLAKALSRKK